VRKGDHDPEVLASIKLADVPSGKRIITTFTAAAEAVGNIDLATIRPTLTKHGL
jgi:hypothetical protein